jgi:hypothetical protein
MIEKSFVIVPQITYLKIFNLDIGRGNKSFNFFMQINEKMLIDTIILTVK